MGMRSEADSTIALRGVIIITDPAAGKVFSCILAYLALPGKVAQPSKVQVENVSLACAFFLF